MATTELVLALDTIKSVEKSLTAVIFNQHQCRRLVDLYSRVGVLLMNIDQFRISRKEDDSFPKIIKSLLVTESVLEKGQILIMSYTSKDWVGRLLTTDVNQDSFEAIYAELEGCIQSIYGACQRGLQVKVPKESVMPLLHLSAGDRQTLFDMDANKDRKQMGHTIECRKYTLSQRHNLDPKEIDEVRSLDMVAEKISQGSKSPEPFEELPSYLRIKSKEIIIGDRLGDGGSADVYRCQWMHQNFAVKIFRGYNDAGMIKEIFNLIPLRHPNIVQLIGFSVDGYRGRAMLVMELLDCDLSDIIKERVRKVPLQPPFQTRESIDLIHQIAWGMAYLHKKKIFHGDLKSRNVLVAKHPGDRIRRYSLKISDFGVSQRVTTPFANDEDFVNSMSLTGGNIGTTRWMAPEIFRGRKESAKPNSKLPDFYSPKADVYSFAITCYEILTGETPYRGLKSHKTISDFVLSGGRPKLPDKLPKDLNNLVVQCWDADPSIRPSFNDICRNIQHLLTLPAEIVQAAEPAQPANPVHFTCNSCNLL